MEHVGTSHEASSGPGDGCCAECFTGLRRRNAAAIDDDLQEFVDSPRDTIGIILTWLMGHLHDEDTPAEINFTKMEDLGKKLGTYCGKNPTHALMRAVEKVTE